MQRASDIDFTFVYHRWDHEGIHDDILVVVEDIVCIMFLSFLCCV